MDSKTCIAAREYKSFERENPKRAYMLVYADFLSVVATWIIRARCERSITAVSSNTSASEFVEITLFDGWTVMIVLIADIVSCRRVQLWY